MPTSAGPSWFPRSAWESAFSDALRRPDGTRSVRTSVPTQSGCEKIVGWAKYSRPTSEKKVIFLELVGREYLAHPTVNRVCTFFHSLRAWERGRTFVWERGMVQQQ